MGETTLKINKHLTKLDLFVVRSLRIVEKYAKYVLISGYVSIFFGRTRATEDVGIFIEEIPFEKFKNFFEDAMSKGYEFTEGDSKKLYYEYLQDNLSIPLRFLLQSHKQLHFCNQLLV